VTGHAVFYRQNRRRRLGIFKKDGIVTHTQTKKKALSFPG
jgi:hypothetical protein